MVGLTRSRGGAPSTREPIVYSTAAATRAPTFFHCVTLSRSPSLHRLFPRYIARDCVAAAFALLPTSLPLPVLARNLPVDCIRLTRLHNGSDTSAVVEAAEHSAGTRALYFSMRRIDL